MRQALAKRPERRAAKQPRWEAREAFVPAPTAGWDTETPVAELPLTKTHGPCDNLIPSGSAVAIRKGYSGHCAPDADDLLMETGDQLLLESGDRLLLESASTTFDPVETLLPYVSGLTSALFAAAGASIYNVTSAGEFPAASLGSLTSARFSFVNFTTSGGSFLWICNGLDDPRHYNGTAWATPALTLTTFLDNDIKYVAAFKERLFFVFKDSLTFGYLPVQNVAGTVSNFPLGAVFNMGGELLALASLSRDGGDGMDDFFVALTTEGEVAVYQGTNPGDADEWALVGVYYVGEPVGDRPFVDLGADLGVITAHGLVSVLGVMGGAELGDADVFARISTPLKQALAAGRGFAGWEGLIIPSEGVLLINAPYAAATARQFIRHSASKSLARFTGWDFETFEVFSGQCYAGTSDGRVVKVFDGYDDDGDDITAACATAWSTLGFPGVKCLQEIRPVLTTATRAVLRLVGRVDFASLPAFGAFPTSTIANALIWGTGLWGTHLWGGEDSTAKQWRAISGEGHNLSVAYEARSNQSQMTLNGFNLRFLRTTGGQV